MALGFFEFLRSHSADRAPKARRYGSASRTMDTYAGHAHGAVRAQNPASHDDSCSRDSASPNQFVDRTKLTVLNGEEFGAVASVDKDLRDVVTLLRKFAERLPCVVTSAAALR
jgi:hypothetical protein